MARVALPYRIYFLYIDPLLAFSGAYLLYTNPQKFITSCTPLSTHPTNELPISALASLLLTQTASLYLMHALITMLVLRAVRPGDRGYLSVWRSVMLAIAVADAGHLWALYESSPEEFWNLAGWRSEDWINYGILMGGLGTRLCFLCGVGVRK